MSLDICSVKTCEEETYPLDHKLLEILQKIKSSENISNIYLRKEGIEIYGKYERTGYSVDKEQHLPLGMLVTGEHLGKVLHRLYLVTFVLDDETFEHFVPKCNLVDLLREYIE